MYNYFKYKKISIIFYLLIITFLFISFNRDQRKTCFRIKNNTNYKITEVALFSQSFRILDRGQKTKYKILNFSEFTDNAMLYLNAKNKRFGLHVLPINAKGKYTYIIDSLNFEHRIIYYKLNKD